MSIILLENNKRHSAGREWTRHGDIYNHINFTIILILPDFHCSLQAPATKQLLLSQS